MRDADELTLREKEILFEMEDTSDEDLLPPEDDEYNLEMEDDEDLHLWDDEDEPPKIPKKPKPSWPEVKAQLNHWGNHFSSGDESQRIIAVERIFALFEEVTETVDDFDSETEQKRWYNHAAGIVRLRFFGETDNPIRYLKHYYPRDLFYDALFQTLGLSVSAEDENDKNPAAGVYDAEKGTQYVTHFTNTLEFFCKRRCKEIADDHLTESIVFSENAMAAEELEEKSAPESQMLQAEEARQQVAALLDLAMLTADTLQLDKMLPIGDDVEGKPQKVKAATLQLFYSFQLVNFTRFATIPVCSRDDRILMSAADEGFLTFSTAIQEIAYWPLVQAELSDFILKRKLYQVTDGKKLLTQAAAACYRGVGESAFSPQFNAAARYLNRHWKYKTTI